MTDTIPAASRTPATLDDILAELTAIRLLLAARPAYASPSPATSSSGANVGDEPIPQPAQFIPDAGAIEIHFGKNSGKTLSSISERSLSWYATEHPPRLDSSGKPYPPRPQEITLRNAARTLWHTNRGTLATGLSQGQSAPIQRPAPAAQPEAAGEDNVPF